MAYSLSLVVLSGPIASGKTTLAEGLALLEAAQHLRTSGLISASAGRELGRSELQRLGLTAHFQGGTWLVDAITELASRSPAGSTIVVDAARTSDQVRQLRRAASGTWRLLHVHLRGDDWQLAERHQTRQRDGEKSWQEVMRSPAETAADLLEAEADLVVDTTRAAPADVAARVIARLGHFRSQRGGFADVLVGGQWGSEGKGNLAFHIAPEYDLLIRCGAPNAGHKVRCPDGTVYTHRQLPSGTRATKSPLLLGPGAVIDVEILLREVADCSVPAERLAIDPAALVIESTDIERETRLKGAIASTGTGGGSALARRIEDRGASESVRTAKDIPDLVPYVREAGAVLEDAQRRGGRLFIEGTQGTGLSILHGTYPHVTSRDTTVGTLLAEVGLPPALLRRVLIAFRAYPIRVGGPSGPMGREITWGTVAQRSGLSAAELNQTEVGSVSGNRRRVAEFSWAQLQRSAKLNGATDLALTFADYIDARNREARRFDQLTQETIEFVSEMEVVASADVSLISVGFDGRPPIDRRLW
jgi:adenylosuccinate synthase